MFAVALCVLITLLVAAVPFAHSLWRRNVAAAPGRQRGIRGTRRDHRIRDALVAVQVALAFVMLVGAGLIGRSLVALERGDAGVDVRDVLDPQLEPNFTKYDTPQKSGFARRCAASTPCRASGRWGSRASRRSRRPATMTSCSRSRGFRSDGRARTARRRGRGAARLLQDCRHPAPERARVHPRRPRHRK